MSPKIRRRHRVAVATAGVSLASIVAALPASAGHHWDSPTTTDCPAPESLVTGTTWSTHHLSKGVMLTEGRHADNHGYVDMHVLRVNVTNKHVAFEPLVRRLAQRSPLSQLATGKPTLVAATNTGYFDFEAGAPIGPLVDRTHPWISSTTKATVVGFGTTGLLQAGDISLSGTITTGRNITTRLAGLNVLKPGTGITAYTSRWGSEPVTLPRDAVTRYVSSGKVSSSLGRFDVAPRAAGGYLLVARGTTATSWLTSLKTRGAATVSTKVTSTTSKPFSLAYGVGGQLVHHGLEGSNFTCRRRYPQPARTAIGYADGGKTLIVALVADDPGTPMHGLDSAQMARLMKDLGAREAYAFDGSGSTELLARLKSNPAALSLRNYPADGAERPIPVGFGIFRK